MYSKRAVAFAPHPEPAQITDVGAAILLRRPTVQRGNVEKMVSTRSTKEAEAREQERTVLPADGYRAVGVSKVGGEGHASEDSNLEYTSEPVRVSAGQRTSSERPEGRAGGAARSRRIYILIRWSSSAGSRMYDSEKTASMTKFLQATNKVS